MADDEQFSLCWNNFNTNLSAGFHESLCRGDLVDVSLVAEGQIVKAHRLVLSVCSPLFRKMFTNMPLNTNAFVYLNNVSHMALKDLIQFMYCGEVNVKQDALPAFISTAESLQIKGLTDNDPAPPPPQEPTPPPAAPIVQQQPPQPVPAQRVQRQQPRTSARYKIETVDDSMGDDNKGTTQIVIQTSAPQTIVQQQPQQQQHIQTQQMQTGTTTTATLVSTNKRTAQRSSLTGGVKRSKTTATSASANVIDALDSANETATTSTTQLVPQQITVQTVSGADSKLHLQPQQLRQQQQQQEEAEYIDLPMELPTKAEPEYSEDHGDAAGDGDTTYVEDDTYGDMRYDDSYFTENEDAGPQAPANTSGNSATATTSKAVIKTQAYSDSSFVDTSADQGNTEAQALTELDPNVLGSYGNESFLPKSSGSGPQAVRCGLATKQKCVRTLDDWDRVRYERTKGGVTLIYDGQRYTRRAIYAENIYWSCSKKQCRALMITSKKKATYVGISGVHNHL
ncbi:modifier of mdg4-like isoform X12 [Drosophila guanche]|uniref:modifier of mdg4-like isoform X12 n=1 Tax=Drosophila guanche TaxID=7266 RepID=UPI0014721685|nr:modifier of mdg4-like isoform X12 [Drosophila guanche]